MVRAVPIVRRMFEYISKDRNWQIHFMRIFATSDFPTLAHEDHVLPTLANACRQLAEQSPFFRRKTLQTRFFETGDNYYLGTFTVSDCCGFLHSVDFASNTFPSSQAWNFLASTINGRTN